MDWRLLDELQRDARLSYSELGRRVGLSPPAVGERVRRMEESGIITGYRAVVDGEAVGLGVIAYVRSRVAGDVERVVRLASASPFVVECHRVTGEDCYLLKLSVPSIADLERVLETFVRYGPTTTSIVLSSPITWRPVSQGQVRPDESGWSASSKTS